MSKELRRLIGKGTTWEIEAGIRSAHTQLVRLRQEVADLETLLFRAYDYTDPTGYWVPWPPLPGPARPPTLHQAIQHVLRTQNNRWMATGKLTRYIKRLGLYVRRDGLPPTVNDVSARISSYPDLFERDEYYVRLRLTATA
ncbi:MAG: hypothetical protein ABR518_06265 [Actinomycetota bacterium]